jgi:hypothetical protein
MVDRGYYEVALLHYYYHYHSFASAVIDLLPAQTVLRQVQVPPVPVGKSTADKNRVSKKHRLSPKVYRGKMMTFPPTPSFHIILLRCRWV